MKKYQKQNAIASVGTAIGVGLIAGLSGTIAMTLCQIAEMKVTHRKPSNTPANAVREVLDVKPVTESKSEKVSNEVHFAYGTSLGMIRGLIGLTGLKGMIANTLHFIIVWGGQIFMLPALRVAPPITHENTKAITTDIVHHLVYVSTAGCVYDAIMCDKNNHVIDERDVKESKRIKGKKRKNNY
ncbi:MAG: hypothetical protein ACTHK0_09015 [Ginsengibacter sp.]